MVEDREDTWYVAIMRSGRRYTPFTGVGGGFYREFASRSQQYGIEIVAEEFNVLDSQIDFLGNPIKGGETEKSPLVILTERLNHGENLNPQEELKKLVESA